jgi:hypothetical protein
MIDDRLRQQAAGRFGAGDRRVDAEYLHHWKSLVTVDN